MLIAGTQTQARQTRPLLRVEALAAQCGWCGAVRIRNRWLRIVGLPIAAWSVGLTVGRLFRVRLGVSHGACARCRDWRLDHELRIVRLERQVEHSGGSRG